jgi:hypothetical protein
MACFLPGTWNCYPLSKYKQGVQTVLQDTGSGNHGDRTTSRPL